MFHQYIHYLSKLGDQDNVIYVYYSQHYQILRLISLFFTLYMAKSKFFIMQFFLCCNTFFLILLVFVYLLQTYCYMYFFYILFFCIFLLVLPAFRSYVDGIFFLYHFLNDNDFVHILLTFFSSVHSEYFLTFLYLVMIHFWLKLATFNRFLT